MSIDSLMNVMLIIFGFGVLIGIHELGHFLAAKWAGIRTNAFAIGMGPVVCSWRGGVGFSMRSTKEKVIARFGKDASEMSDKELQTHGLSETEYSLRILPIGGFVSMLGQEDGNPDAVSADLRSYNKCPIGKRMIVVSAGVVMNLLLAAVLFVGCFQVGVNFEAPIIGHIVANSPAAKAMSLSIPSKPLELGDTVISVDGTQITTFTELQIAGAMSKSGESLTLEVQKEGLQELFTYSLQPAKVSQNGLLELGLYPSYSSTLRTGRAGKEIAAILQTESSPLRDLNEGMQLVSADGESIDRWSSFQRILQASNGNPIQTKWVKSNLTQEIVLPVFPSLVIYRSTGLDENSPQKYERGLLGLVPLTSISSVLQSGPNASILQDNDVILKAASIESPRMGQLRAELASLPDGPVEVTVLRDGEKTDLVCQIKSGKLGIVLIDALNIPRFAQPLQENLIDVQGVLVQATTPIAGLQLLGGSEIISINGEPVSNWSDIRSRIVEAGELVSMEIVNPTVNRQLSSVTIEVTPEQQQVIASLGWTTMLIDQMFEPMYVVRSSGGNPVTALRMGFEETVNMVVMTYLTIDRLFRRTVGVDQLRGPIGIVHIGSRIADRGFSYLLFFLAIISVNLAVLNFLPLPIVDGGLFLYLVYEKLIGKPPSLAFQNAAAVLGLGMIGMLFVVTFYNDIVRLVG